MHFNTLSGKKKRLLNHIHFHQSQDQDAHSAVKHGKSLKPKLKSLLFAILEASIFHDLHDSHLFLQQCHSAGSSLGACTIFGRSLGTRGLLFTSSSVLYAA